MPAAISTKCAMPTCRALATYRGRCPAHALETERNRGSSAERGYDAGWRAFRVQYLRAHPLCADCTAAGFYDRRAREVHHVVKLRDGGEKLDPANCRALCRSCHQVRTARGE